MPETRRSQRLQTLGQQNPSPAMSRSYVTFIVSEPFRDYPDYRPIRRARSTRECLNHVRQCLGETIEGNARFIITAAPMATGGYGQEAVFGYDAGQRNQAGPTVSDISRAVAEVERTVWDNEAERAENQARIGRVIDQYEKACDHAERAGYRVF